LPFYLLPNENTAFLLSKEDAETGAILEIQSRPRQTMEPDDALTLDFPGSTNVKK
jgi:hypothetical protein